eukprot:TRINITY_DN12175_c7_g1_i1.p1 TRINITY_DN12175_c7_g1~~TRINITY_DN12175_c7_g1_i1.p1  ORF type:complete len:565 (+),score=51.04 TRINITY_DN12175_c7_g1_i1:2-1696(+)
MSTRWLFRCIGLNLAIIAILIGRQPAFAPVSEKHPLLYAATSGDVTTVQKQLNRAESTFVSDVAGRTALHLLMEGMHHFISHNPFAFDQRYQDIFGLLLRTNPRLIAFRCPIIHAFHLRLLPFADVLLDRMTASHARLCLLEKDAYGDTIAHVLARSKAAGFARLFHRAMSSERAMPPALYNFLGVAFNRTALKQTFPRIHRLQLDRQLGDRALLLLDKHELLTPELISARNALGHTSLHVAAQDGRSTRLLALLVDNGADLEAKDRYGRTALHLAAALGLQDTVLWLLEHGANVKAVDDAGQTACDLAQRFRYERTLAVLHKHDASCQPIANTSLSALKTCSGVVDIVNTTMTADAFRREYIALQRPALLRNFTRSPGNKWPATSLWQPERLAKLQRYNLDVAVGAIPYASTYGFKAGRMPLAEYARRYLLSDGVRDKPYVFDGQAWSQSPVLQRDLPIPTEFIGSSIVLAQLIVGPNETGASPHFHGNAINCLAVGSKNWQITSPSASFFKVTRANLHFATVPNHDFCVQREGDVMFVPNNFGHAVLNLETTAAMAFEFIPH